MIGVYNIRLILADDHEIFLDGLQAMLEKQPGIEVIARTSDGKETVRVAKENKPDIILMDIQMPIMNGIAATKILTDEEPSISVIALSMFDQEDQIVNMLEVGAKGYLLKNAHKSEISEAIQSVYLNKPYYSSSITSRLAHIIGHSRHNPFRNNGAIIFSDRERDIIRLICEEKTTKEIAGILCISNRTVENYRFKIYEKMDVKSVAGAVIYAVKNNLHSKNSG